MLLQQSTHAPRFRIPYQPPVMDSVVAVKKEESPLIPLTKSLVEEEPDKSVQLPDGVYKVPCRARGVPADHTFQTAYFLIKEGTPHGTLLKCSHPFCSESGYKFRYCMFCNVPVAKRNFTKRHSHLPFDNFGRKGLPHSEKGRMMLSEEPIRLTAKQRQFLECLKTRPPLDAEQNLVQQW